MNKNTKIKNKNFNIKDSQNFLHNTKLVEDLLFKSNITKEDFVVEIGPGKGIITKALSKICKAVTAIEFDSVLADKLTHEFKSSNVSIIEADFLKYNLPDHNYKVFSNIPFNITASILNKLLDSENPPLD
ncbi:ribosomal RNA small subunit methyltransferase A, partial [Klebsiella pneumoniae]